MTATPINICKYKGLKGFLVYRFEKKSLISFLTNDSLSSDSSTRWWHICENTSWHIRIK